MSVTMSVALALAGERQSCGQNALDANLSTQGKTNHAAPQQDFRSRNLIVTGDVGDGRGFRGSIGYRAADDFQGTLGSETLRSFRAYSASSDPLLFQSMNSLARLETAQGSSLLEFRRGFGMDAAGTAYAGTAVRLDRRDVAAITAARTRFNDRAMRDDSGSAFMLDGRPRTVRELANTAISINPVSGLQAVEPTYAKLSEILSPYDLVRLRYMERTMSTRDVVQPFKSPLRKEQGLAAKSSDDEARKLAPDSYWKATAEIEKRLTDAGKSDLPGAVDGIRRMLGDTGVWGSKLAEAGVDRYAIPTVPTDAAGSDLGAGTGRDGEEKKDDWNTKDAALVLAHRESLDTLVPEGAGRASDVLRAAQGAFTDGRYTSAATLFQSAMLLSPNNPLAQTGRAVSLAAGGLGASAGIELRQLFANHPEMIAMRLEGAIRPTDKRWRDVGTVCLELGQRATALQKGDLGLTAAWAGWQVDDAALIRAGLQLAGEDPATAELAALLRAIWLAPAPAP